MCTVILADFTAEQICIENKVDEILDTAFGVNETPSWEDFLAFLADRCIPKTRKGLDYYLDAVGVPEYDPVLLVEKTMIISGKGEDSSSLYTQVDRFVRTLHKSVVVELEDKVEADEQTDGDYVVDEKHKTCTLTAKGES